MTSSLWSSEGGRELRGQPWVQTMDSTDPEKVGPRAVRLGRATLLQLLQDCSGAFQPGILTALVGSSGAGKTTLLDVLAGRKTRALPFQQQELRVGGRLWWVGSADAVPLQRGG